VISVAVVAFRYDRFDDVLPVEVRAEQLLVGAHAAAALAAGVEVVNSFTVSSVDEGLQTRDAVRTLDPDVVVAVPVTAVPPAWVAASIPEESIIVLWDVGSGDSLPPIADQVRAHRDTASVGAIMAGGALAATNRRFTTVSAPVRDVLADEVLDVVRLAAGANTLAHLRVMRIGHPIPGYSTIPIDPGSDEYRSIGLEVIDVELERFIERVRELRQGSRDDSATRSRTVRDAVRSLCVEHAPHAIAINCHGALLGSPDVGIVCCAAATECNEADVPTACTADVPTAYTLFAATTLAGSALYCEPYSVDDAAGAVLLANCGIGHPRMAADGTWRTLPSQQYPGAAGRGESVAMAVRPGPATYHSVRVRAPKWTLVAIEGEVIDKKLSRFGGAHAYFAPTALTARQMIETLADTGVVHHGALGLGHHRDRLEVLGRLASFDVVNV
jgi:L-fucose isomerase-like protein